MGERIREKWTTRLCKAFTNAGLKCFGRQEAAAAWNPLEKNEDRKRTVERAVRLRTVARNPTCGTATLGLGFEGSRPAGTRATCNRCLQR